VRLDTVYGNRADQAILLHYGNPGATDKSDAPSVFPPAGGFAGVWHMDDTAAGAVALERHDASGLGRQGVNRSTLPDSAGAIGTAAYFDGAGGFIDLPASSAFVARADQPLTLSCWFLPQDSLEEDGRLIDVHRADTNGSTIALGYGKGGKVFYYSHQDKIFFNTSEKPVVPGAWHQAAVTFDGKFFRLYVDGVPALGPIGGSLPAGGTYHAKIGKYGDTQTNAFHGGIDEARIANTVRQAAWIKLDYESQRASQRFLRFAP
jgi:hypothetical protein